MVSSHHGHHGHQLENGPAAGWSPGLPRIPVLPSPSPPAAPDLDEPRDVRVFSGFSKGFSYDPKWTDKPNPWNHNTVKLAAHSTFA